MFDSHRRDLIAAVLVSLAALGAPDLTTAQTPGERRIAHVYGKTGPIGSKR